MTSVRWWLGLATLLAPALVLGAQAQPAQCVPRESFPGFVAQFKRDADFRATRILFPFVRIEGCWTLTRVELGGS